ncbi:hypothetical protein WICPIJ_005636 [Wickerhamomyces pijperi]|uniref:Major facilitator superfamily (MFS) profile domain-containing protein n=1 Tax=Wickerhamomyces pijperi TaxID=599730 RepID=A0A9P8Q385_WICPI|nr:hypothetical protein WICPIJ_005636 [Wickerhamomyces pijperi]
MSLNSTKREFAEATTTVSIDEKNLVSSTSVKETSSLDDDEATEEKKEGFFSKYGGILVGGSAFISDGFQQGIPSIANVLLSAQYSTYTTSYKTMFSNSLLISNIIGQVSFGFLADRLGRKPSFAFSTALIVIGSILCACAKSNSDVGLFWFLIIARGITGTGIGGEYPLSATSAMETANEKIKSRKKLIPFILASNFPISMGVPMACIAFLIVLAAVGGEHTKHKEAIWRTLFAIGAIIPLTIFFFRWKMHHAESYKNNAIKKNVPYWLALKKYWREFAGTAGMWFLMDFILYPNNIFSASIITVAIPGAGIQKLGEWQLFLSSFGVFGTLIGCVLINYISIRKLIICGFILYGVLSFIVGGCFEIFSKHAAALIIFYALMNLVLNAGVANYQSIVSSASFPTSIRGTAYGISAGIGKAGAAIGTSIFTPLQQKHGKKSTFYLSGAVALIGAVVVYFGVPDYSDKDLDFLDEEFNDYLLANGWNGEVGEFENKRELVQEEEIDSN